MVVKFVETAGIHFEKMTYNEVVITLSENKKFRTTSGSFMLSPPRSLPKQQRVRWLE
jgi:ATP-dependent Zn protease